MKQRSKSFLLKDLLYLCIFIVPFLVGIVIKVLTTPASEGISISGARIFLDIPFPVQNLVITESQINSWLVMISIFGLCMYLTNGLSARTPTRRQHFAEMMVQMAEKLVISNMGEYFKAFAPFIAAMIGLSGFSSLVTLCGLYPPTSDVNVTGGWAILVFILITYYKAKCGPIMYIKSFANPVLMAPLNIISEVATPVSMAFRHYGNVLSGAVISVLLASGLQGLSAMVFGEGMPPFFQIGIPGVLSVYFDLFSGLLQAYIFAMLTMLYVSGGFPIDEYMKRKEKKQNKKAQKA